MQGLPAEMKSVPMLLGDTLVLHGYASPLNDPGNQIELPPFAEALAELDADRDGGLAAGELEHPKLRELFVFFDLRADGTLDAEEWDVLRANLLAKNAAMAIRVGGQGDVTATNVLWSTHRSIPQLPSPLVYAGVYYMLADQGGLLTLLDPKTGERLERGRLADGIDAYYAAPVAADGKVYLLGESRSVGSSSSHSAPGELCASVDGFGCRSVLT